MTRHTSACSQDFSAQGGGDQHFRHIQGPLSTRNVPYISRYLTQLLRMISDYWGHNEATDILLMQIL